MLYQNNLAIAYLLGYHEEKKSVDTVKLLKELENKNNAIAKATDGGIRSASSVDLEWLLQTNKELRRLYSNTAGAYLKKFDDHYVPLLGWKEYYESKLE